MHIKNKSNGQMHNVMHDMHVHEFTTCGSPPIFSSSMSANGSSRELAVASPAKYFYSGMSPTNLCIGIDFLV